MPRYLLAALALSTTLHGVAIAAPPVTLVAPTDKLSPEQEKASFTLPPGFEAQLVAAEPDIAKPMNIAFDSQGRLWVTDTIEYPWPVTEGKGRDAVKVLSDFNAAGRATKVTTFADGLNIPLGVLPTGDGAIVYSIPEVRRYRDTDGDGKADKIEPLLTGFGSVDTHGMTNNFVRGFDGWVYANHGFRNESVVKGSDGSTITMQSGNTYRFRPDGAKVQLYARGQVNPFGLAFDPMGNLFSADCHTRPQYLLLRGAVYPSFGKPDDGLGFGPEMCLHDHGSTGIAGTMVYAADKFPPAYRGNLFNGNPVTNKINRDRLQWTGSTPKAVAEPDFLVSSDPWFRPVQVVLGPDGAMYVADFYNKIIGHYEVDLKHPGRDRTSGRIWRIVYKGTDAKQPNPQLPNLAAQPASQMIEWLGDANLAVRMAAMHRLVDSADATTPRLLTAALKNASSAEQRVHLLWAMERLGALSPEQLNTAAADASPAVRAHTMRMLAERQTLDDAARRIVIEHLSDADAFVCRAATEAAGRHPHESFLEPLLALAERTPAGDTHLLHAAKISLRDQLAGTDLASRLPKMQFSQDRRIRLLESALGVSSPAAGTYAAWNVNETKLPAELAGRALKHAVKFARDEKTIDEIVDVASTRFGEDVGLQLELIAGVRAALTSRGGEMSGAAKAWAAKVAQDVLVADFKYAQAAGLWQFSVSKEHPTAVPWLVQTRKCADGKSADFWTSHPRGEKLTGVLRTQPFAAPKLLTFWIAGHNGEPTSADPAKNHVALKDAQTSQTLHKAPAARNDVAQEVKWDLSPLAGRQVFLEAVDDDTRSAYAWIAFGRLEPAVAAIPSPAPSPRQIEQAVELAGAIQLQSAAGYLHRLLDTSSVETPIRIAAAKSVASMNPETTARILDQVMRDADTPAALREECIKALGTMRDPAAIPILLKAVTLAPQATQRTLALSLVSTRAGGEALLAAVGEGKASPRLLQDKALRDKLGAAGIDRLDETLARLTKGLPEIDEALQKAIDARKKAFVSAGKEASVERGALVFTKNCAACHRFGQEGGLVGPQLDGLAQRGLDRVVEDILDPSRNVDGAFRNTILTLKDGDVVTGLQRHVEENAIVFADSNGKEFSIAKDRIAKRVESQLSLMPANFHEVLSQEQFLDLLAFLLKR